MNVNVRKSWGTWLMVIGLIALMTWPRLTALNQYLIVDEADRWRWAREFVTALSQGDLAGTLVGDGYPGIVPVWAESVWIFIEAIRRSMVEGQWLGDVGLAYLFHEWNRLAYLDQQRLPIVVMNTLIALAIVGAVWRLFGKRVALVGGVLIALDPFYLSDSRVNRAEAVITGLMTLSVLSLIFYYRHGRFRYVILSGILGGLSFLTKIQALAMLPAIGLTALLIYADGFKRGRRAKDRRAESDRADERSGEPRQEAEAGESRGHPPAPAGDRTLTSLIWLGLGWAGAACLTWIILWPSMWVTPLETLTLVYDYTTRKVGAEGVNLFFLGQTYQDADPGLLFYPVVFFMRITPLTLVGLLGAAIVPFVRRRGAGLSFPGDPFAVKGSAILVIYILMYALVMTVGSHKQDRYLMPVFLGLDILAAFGIVFVWAWVKSKLGASGPGDGSSFYSLIQTPYAELGLFAGLIAVQMATVLPHHPYYYTYFNPLFGGGQTAVRTLRIGWGEGMDQVGAYLGAKPNSEELVVSTRFTHNMLGFDGRLISLVPGGRWTQADYIVLYIQQVQRGQDPTPGFIDYFQSRPPEKVVTLNGIDYAWIYPIPFTTPANPEVSVIPGQAALLGYRWERAKGDGRQDRAAGFQLRLFWENLGLEKDRSLAARLMNSQADTDWAVCSPEPAFATQAQTPGAYVESLCSPSLADLPAGNYTVEFGLASGAEIAENRKIERFLFPEGWHAAQVRAGEVTDTAEIERLAAIVAEKVPTSATRLDRVYDGRVRLAAYQLDPAEPTPGASLALTLYWQAVGEVIEPIHAVIQLAESRDLSLGRKDRIFHAEKWLPGEVIASRHQFELKPELDSPLAARIEVSLKDQVEVFLQPTTLAGRPLDAVAGTFTIAPDRWPVLDGTISLEAAWSPAPPPSTGSEDQQAGPANEPRPRILLRGYRTEPEPVRPGETLDVTLLWEPTGPIPENYMVFVHLLDEAGQIQTQNDSLPRAGAYPTLWWQPGNVVEDTHPLSLPPALPDGVYQLVVGLYQPETGQRLLTIEGDDQFVIGPVEIR